jgi:hypothetical protein
MAREQSKDSDILHSQEWMLPAVYAIEFTPEANEDMKAITIPARARMLNDLLRKARRKEVVLESADGERFVLASIQRWEGFEVGEDDNITKNTRLMSRLRNRRSGGERIPLAEVQAQLGLS